LNTSWHPANFTRTPNEPPRILPTEALVRPQWSVMIPVYNAGPFLKESILSVLKQAQDEVDMQIQVVDDCSTDVDVESFVYQLGNGRIEYYRQPFNVGSLRNFETCINRAKGKYIHLLHSDDLVHPGFYKRLESLFERYPTVGAAFCHYQYIDETGKVVLVPDAESTEEGILENWLLRLSERQRIQYVAIAVKREVYEELGAFYGVHYGEDWEMWARIASRYPFAYTPAILASYRRHENSISGKSFSSAQNLNDLEFVMKKINRFLPEHERKAALQRAKKFYAYYALRTAGVLWGKFRDSKGARMQMKKAWSMHQDISLAYQILKMVGRLMINR
jgi:glycosyltransferase involved in cell wall biosynthesis